MTWIRIGTERVDVERGRAVRAVCRELEPLPPVDDEPEPETGVDLDHYWVDEVAA